MLRQVLASQPDFAPARWHTGFVRQGDRWLDLDQVRRQATQDKRLAEYRQLRDALAFHPQGEWNLARWCRDHGLPSEARAHWMRTLAAQPQNAEAINALGLVWHQGLLLTRDQIEQLRKPRAKAQNVATKTAREEREWTTHWETQLAKWRRAGQADDKQTAPAARHEMDAAKEAAAVFALGRLLSTRSQWTQDRKFYQGLSLALVQSLEYRDESWAVPQLVRYAVEHPLPDVRTAAAEALRKRTLVDYVPLLLQRLRLPIEVSGSIVSLGLGGAVYQYTLEQEGPNAVLVKNHAVHMHVRDTRGATSLDPGTVIVQGTATKEELKSAQVAAGANVAASLAAGQARAAQQSATAHQQAVATLNAVQHTVGANNAEVANLNRRVYQALAQSTGAEVADNPLAWMKWWKEYCYDYFEMAYPTDEDESAPKPVCETTWYGYRSMPFTTPYPAAVRVGKVSRSVSCFPWNTKVWTLTGPTNIDQIKPGDRVLAQHPYTGELAYKPVLQVTTRKPSPMVEIGVGKAAVLATRGHPFWVCGQGWKMAKQLQVGWQLHTVSGPAAIERLQQAPAAGLWYDQLKQRPDAKPEDVLSYNLVVDEFHTYFVGDARLLVHDNILFPLDGPVPPVPGLASSP